ncbi:COP1-interactive protein 1-like [Hibiscus syriacus]|uniref:COP1-interactive protein 1-like n=1 Tax=Hibiscus syriacus TaxID=106335 RepID=UPI0019248605|nr:COP1-interactive protein 1-like [Hibiscus syriacus]
MEQVNVYKTDVDKKVEKILKFVKRRNRGKKETELVRLVEDFHKQYQLLYAQYDHLKQGLGMEAGEGLEASCSKHGKHSDSEYYSSEDVEINSNRNSFRKRSMDMEDELRGAYTQIFDLKNQLASRTKEKEALDFDHKAALTKIQEIETMNGYLRNEMDETKKRLFGLKTELESQHNQRRELEVQINGITAELQQEREKSKALVEHISEEVVAQHLNKIKENENSLTSKMEDSLARVSNLQKEVDYLRAQKREAKRGISCKINESFDQVNQMKEELEVQLHTKSKEISQYLVQEKTLKEELARKSAAEQIMVEEKEGLQVQVQVMGLESDVDALRKEKNKSEDEVKSNVREISTLRDEKRKLNARILELETLLRKSEPVCSGFPEDNKSKMLNEAAQMKVEVDRLQPKLDSIMKSPFELPITDLQTTQEKDQSTSKSMPPKTKLVRRLSLGNNFNFHVLERKMEDLAMEFRKKIDDSIRLLYQRIKVVERIQHENTEVYKTTKRGLEQEIKALKQEVATIEEEYGELREEVATLKAGNKALRHEVATIEDDEEALRQEVATLKAGNKALRQEVAELEAGNGALKQEVATFEAEDITLRQEVATLKAGNKALRQEVATIKEVDGELRREVVTLKAGNKALRQEVDVLEAGNEALKQEVATFEAQLKKLRDMMESGKNITMDKLEDDRNFLTPISIVTDEECETRVERMKSSVDVLVAEMQKEDEEELLRERVMNLESKLREEGEEKSKAMSEVNEKMRYMQRENDKLREEVMNLEAKLSKEAEEKLKSMSEVEKKMRELRTENVKLTVEVMNLETKLSEE